MHVAKAFLESISPYSQSAPFKSERPDKMAADEFEAAYWREKCHVDESGSVFIPPMCFKKAIATSAIFRKDRIKGKGSAEYGKHFVSGILVVDPLPIPYTRESAPMERVYCDPTGSKKGSGKRVWRYFPTFPKWSGEVTFHVLDDIINEETFAITLEGAGQFIGIGRFRPENGGYYGRFKVNKLVWE